MMKEKRVACNKRSFLKQIQSLYEHEIKSIRGVGLVLLVIGINIIIYHTCFKQDMAVSLFGGVILLSEEIICAYLIVGVMKLIDGIALINRTQMLHLTDEEMKAYEILDMTDWYYFVVKKIIGPKMAYYFMYDKKEFRAVKKYIDISAEEARKKFKNDKQPVINIPFATKENEITFESNRIALGWVLLGWIPPDDSVK